MKKVAVTFMAALFMFSVSSISVSAAPSTNTHVAQTNASMGAWSISDYDVWKQRQKYNLFGPDYK